nr:MAG TPA: hypothetical protein [Caudoviricetes sp.]
MTSPPIHDIMMGKDGFPGSSGEVRPTVTR